MAVIDSPFEADNSAAALAMDELLAEKAARLLDHPRLGRPGRVAGTRELMAHPNDILIYAIAGEQVRVFTPRAHRARRQHLGIRPADPEQERTG